MFQRLCHTRIGRQLTELWCWGRTSCTFIWMNSEGQLVLTARALCGLVHKWFFSCLPVFLTLLLWLGVKVELGFWRASVLVLWRYAPQMGTEFFQFSSGWNWGHSSICTNQVGSDAMEQDLEANQWQTLSHHVVLKTGQSGKFWPVRSWFEDPGLMVHRRNPCLHECSRLSLIHMTCGYIWHMQSWFQLLSFTCIGSNISDGLSWIVGILRKLRVHSEGRWKMTRWSPFAVFEFI